MWSAVKPRIYVSYHFGLVRSVYIYPGLESTANHMPTVL